MRVLVAGATGAIGRPLVRRLIDARHVVAGLTRSADRAAALAKAGASPLVSDVLADERLAEKVAGFRPEAVIHQMTAIPPRIDPRRVAEQLEPTNRLRTEGTRRLLAAAKAAGVRRFLAQSVAFAYAPGRAGLRREDDPLFVAGPPQARRLVDALVQLEESTLGAGPGVEGIVLRYGYFYGPGTVYAGDGSFAEDIRRRRVPVVGVGTGVFSFIHVDDAAAATVAALACGVPGVYNIVDDKPTPAGEWIPGYARLLDAPAPWRVPRLLARIAAGAYAVYLMCDQAGADNSKAKTELGWQPVRPSFLEGVRELSG